MSVIWLSETQEQAQRKKAMLSTHSSTSASTPWVKILTDILTWRFGITQYFLMRFTTLTMQVSVSTKNLQVLVSRDLWMPFFEDMASTIQTSIEVIISGDTQVFLHVREKLFLKSQIGHFSLHLSLYVFKIPFQTCSHFFSHLGALERGLQSGGRRRWNKRPIFKTALGENLLRNQPQGQYLCTVQIISSLFLLLGNR